MSYVRRTAEQLEEAKRQTELTDRLMLAFAECPTTYLRRLELFSGVLGHLDRPIDLILDNEGKEAVSRLYALVVIYRLLNLLISSDPMPSGKTAKDILAEAKAAAESAAKPAPVKEMPLIGPCCHKTKLTHWERRITGKKPHEVRRMREQRNEIQRRYRAKCKAKATITEPS